LVSFVHLSDSYKEKPHERRGTTTYFFQGMSLDNSLKSFATLALRTLVDPCGVGRFTGGAEYNVGRAFNNLLTQVATAEPQQITVIWE
jgi:hypothetical protein